jgi:hypothetical protein
VVSDAGIPELTTLAETIGTWWPAVLVFLRTGLTNAQTGSRSAKREPRAGSGTSELPPPRTVALHPTIAPDASEDNGARSRLKSRIAKSALAAS